MIILGFCAVVAIVLAIWCALDADDAWLGVVGGLFLGFMVWACINTIPNIIIGNDYQPSNRERIVAVADGSETAGRFGLFSGYVEETQYYFFYVETPQGVEQGKVPVNSTRIIETEQSYGEKVTLNDAYKGFRPWYYHYGDATRWELRVPEGTIVRKFNLDLEN